MLADQELTEYVYRSLIRPGIEKAERGRLQAATDAGVVRAVDLPVVARLVYAMGLGIDLLAQIGDAQTQALLAAGDRLADAFTELLLDGVAAVYRQPLRPDPWSLASRRCCRSWTWLLGAGPARLSVSWLGSLGLLIAGRDRGNVHALP